MSRASMGNTENETRESISDGVPAAESPGRSNVSRGTKRAFTGFGVLMLGVLVMSVFFFLNFKTVQVSGSSMLPTYKNGNRVLVSKAYWLIGPIRKKDVVVLRDDGPTGYIIKRVAYMAGEAVDWKQMPESHRFSQGKFLVPPGTIYVLGDNLPESEDSRKFGPVGLDQVLGKVVVRP
ncbi:MAG: signal peptidase I [Fimbriimonas sp.]